jgi:hypothetical protein
MGRNLRSLNNLIKRLRVSSHSEAGCFRVSTYPNSSINSDLCTDRRNFIYLVYLFRYFFFVVDREDFSSSIGSLRTHNCGNWSIF